MRRRSIVSHLLPLLLALPLAGISLIYGIQQSALVPSLAQELANQAQLIAELTRTNQRSGMIPLRARRSSRACPQ